MILTIFYWCFFSHLQQKQIVRFKETVQKTTKKYFFILIYKGYFFYYQRMYSL